MKEGSSNMNCMRNFFIMIKFIRECRGQEILRERTGGDVGFAPCFIFYFLQTKSFVQILPKLKWILSRIYEMIYIWRNFQARDPIISITIIHPINLLFIRLKFAQSTNGDIVSSSMHSSLDSNEHSWKEIVEELSNPYRSCFTCK